jgi:hypothetical protein
VAFSLAWSYCSAGDFPAAFREYERGATLAPTDRFRLGSTALMLAPGAGDRVQMQRWLAWHGDTQAALEALRQGLKQGSMQVTTFTLWAPGLREVREAGLVDYWKPVGDDDFECH